MADYEKMYFELFNGITDTIEKLKELQQKAEESYIEAKRRKLRKTPTMWVFFIYYIATCCLSSRFNLSAIIAINSEFVGFPLVFETV